MVDTLVDEVTQKHHVAHHALVVPPHQRRDIPPLRISLPDRDQPLMSVTPPRRQLCLPSDVGDPSRVV